MNERITQFAEECGFRKTTNLYDRNQSFNIGKFADLIIFECIKLAVFKGDTETGRAIKEHFKVEDYKGWICPKCGIDRTKDSCPQGHTAAIEGSCPMIGVAQ